MTDYLKRKEATVDVFPDLDTACYGIEGLKKPLHVAEIALNFCPEGAIVRIGTESLF